MKTVGFVKERDKEIIRQEYWDIPVLSASNVVDEIEKGSISHYLQNADSVFAITLALTDGEKYIGSYMVFTDGVWLWPSHFFYYLNKSNFACLHNDFLHHIRSKDHKIFPLSEEERKEAGCFFEKNVLRW